MAPRIYAICIAALLTSPAFAHKDAIIQWNQDDRLETLPPEFQPAKLYISFAQDGQLQRVQTLTLEVGGKRVVLPPCVTASMRVVNRSTVRILGSWYHDLTLGPPYISVELYESDPRSTSPKHSHILHFDLATAKLVEVARVRYSAHTSVISSKQVDFRSACAGQDLAPFSERREDYRPNTSLERTRGR